MANPVDIQLSALIDEELEAAEFEMLAERLSRDKSLRARYSRFAMIGEVLRNDAVLLDREFAERVRADVAREPSGPLPTLGGLQTYLRPVLGMAIAASVAVVALLTLTPGSQMPITGEAPGVAMQNGATYTVPAANTASTSEPERLEFYFLRHGEYAPMARKSTYSRVISELPATEDSSDDGAPEDGSEPDRAAADSEHQIGQ